MSYDSDSFELCICSSFVVTSNCIGFSKTTGFTGFRKLLSESITIMPHGTLGGYKGDFWKYGETIDYFPKNMPSSLEECMDSFKKSNFKINKKDKIIVFGSCFSQHLLNGLKSKGYTGVDNCLIPSGLNNPFAIKQLLQYVITGDQSNCTYAYNQKYINQYWKGDRKSINTHLISAKAVIITIGLAEYWKDKSTGGVFWMGIPESVYDEAKHELCVATQDEIKNELDEIQKLLPCPIIFTMCPVPLNATFTGKDAFTANSYSKSICRSAMGLHIEQCDNSYYFPVYELCTEISLRYPSWGTAYDPKIPRHISSEMINAIGRLFELVFT